MLAWMLRKGNSCALLMGMYTGIAPMENSMENSQKIEIELLHDPATPFLGIYQKEMKTLT